MARTTLRTWILLPAALAFGASIAPIGCGGDDVPTLTIGEVCAINSDCASPLVCAFERCHNQCETDRDCDTGQRCVEAERPNRVCQLTDESACKYNSECPGQEVCAVDDQCRDQCAADRDCGAGQICATGTCATPTELVDGDLPAAPDSQVAGQPCAYNSDCPSGLVCRDNGLCGYECFEDVDCPGKAKCDANHQCADMAPIFCVPGQTFLCECGDGAIHHQTCDAEGQGVDDCDCPP